MKDSKADKVNLSLMQQEKNIKVHKKGHANFPKKNKNKFGYGIFRKIEAARAAEHNGSTMKVMVDTGSTVQLSRAEQKYTEDHGRHKLN